MLLMVNTKMISRKFYHMSSNFISLFIDDIDPTGLHIKFTKNIFQSHWCVIENLDWFAVRIRTEDDHLFDVVEVSNI